MCVMVELTELMELYQSDVHFHSRDRHKDLYNVENLTCSDQLKNQELERRQKLEKRSRKREKANTSLHKGHCLRYVSDFAIQTAADDQGAQGTGKSDRV
jgi:hypothetical protein